MEYITTTGLRTKTSELISALKKGTSVSLIHRSKVVGIVKPIVEAPKTFNAARFKRLVEALNLPQTTHAERERIYRAHLMKKYGKGISGRK